ncbi:E3 ubiquitin-protein ligase RMA1H1-like [Amaranthus tricolor]|uniref:E3 ubiquitin-protein ligase RMA1H1-like n=1 Tax=Amaranthus tricolor TaxID=29722 RepID=UPI002583B2F4|nr:E3 ubiquitin-protein ligase RMA1H1-like [Amaranthus tricolor]
MEYFAESVKQSKSSDEGLEKLKSSSSGDAETNISSGFDCNICLDIVRDPVITFCGHLYCWPCIYRWIQSERSSSENFVLQQQSQCPVCKAQVTQNTLIPLYGRGQSREQPDQTGGKIDLVIPHRPSGPRCGVHTIITGASTSPHPSQQLNYHAYSHPRYHQVHPLYSDEHSWSPTLGFAGTTTYNPMIDIFGEMIYDRMFGNLQTTLYTCPNTYSVATMSSPRLRRHVMQVDRSLSRVKNYRNQDASFSATTGIFHVYTHVQISHCID